MLPSGVSGFIAMAFMKVKSRSYEAASGLSGPRTPAVVLPLRFWALSEDWPVKQELRS